MLVPKGKRKRNSFGKASERILERIVRQMRRGKAVQPKKLCGLSFTQIVTTERTIEGGGR